MSDFNYQEYLKNNPLLQKEVKDQLITEGLNEEMAVFSSEEEEDKYIEKMVKKGLEKEKERAAKKALKNVKEEEVTEEEVPSSKMKVSELKAKIKEDIISLLNEEDEEIDAAADEIEPDDAEIDVEDEVEADIEAPAPSSDAGLSKDEQDIQDSLKVAYDKAVSIGDEKLADQIGNSITFFTRSHVVER